jgi:hypothetical protein
MIDGTHGYVRNIKSSVYCIYVYQVGDMCERNKVFDEEVTAG